MDADDLPETYWVLATVYGFRFVLDLQEGDRVGALFAAYQEGGTVDHHQFFQCRDYTGAPLWVNYSHLSAFYLSTSDSRAFDDAMQTDRKKRGWGEAEAE